VASLKVGDGRGFVVDRYIITAAHCLPRFPPCFSASLLGPLDRPSTVWAECAFVDPIADIAVLCSPDNQELSKEAEACEGLVGGLTPQAVADEASNDAFGWLFILAGQWGRLQGTALRWSPFCLR
jgi:hypothetical protein